MHRATLRKGLHAPLLELQADISYQYFLYNLSKVCITATFALVFYCDACDYISASTDLVRKGICL